MPVKLNRIVPNTLFSNRELYLTTTLPYVNSSPHIGHAFEFVISDFLKRYYNLLHQENNSELKMSSDFFNYKSFLNTGIDEHGQKVAQKAIELNMLPQDYCDKMSDEWKLFCIKLNMNYDNFYRTTSKKHQILSQDFLYAIKDLIYEKSYEGKYCSGCESFKTEKEINNQASGFNGQANKNEPGNSI